MASMTRTTDTPMRDGSRDGSVGCLVCGAALASTRARYCSRAHQQRAFRLRHQADVDLRRVRQQLQRRRALIAHTSTSAQVVLSASSACVGPRSATRSAERSAWAVTARSARHPCRSSTRLERR
jgi:hypothetical protein